MVAWSGSAVREIALKLMAAGSLRAEIAACMRASESRWHSDIVALAALRTKERGSA
jgi:hypothetical protein